jgi:outer membrane protein assembly factor BamA
MRFLWLLALALVCSSMAEAQLPPCFRSKYSNEWPVNLRGVTIIDGEKLPRQDKARIVRELKRQCDCWPCALSDEVSEQIRDMYRWFGYYQAVVDVDIKKLGIDSYSIRARVQEGPQYRLRDIVIANAKAFPADALRRQFPLQSGDIFDTRLFRHGLDSLRQMYSTRGYLNFTAVPATQVDTSSGTIALRIDVDEGPIFRIGPLLITGLEPSRGFGKKLLDDWRPHVGKVYDSTFVDGFISQNLSGIDKKLNVTYIQDAQAGTVAVRVEFR